MISQVLRGLPGHGAAALPSPVPLLALPRITPPGTTRTVNGITVKVRSVADMIQLCPEDGCGWFELPRYQAYRFLVAIFV
jgi:hypothetical protein